jgi:hypothetical protein
MARQSVTAVFLALFGGQLLCGANVGRAQSDPQSSYEPRSNPGVGQKYLESFVGDWDVTKKFYPRTGEPVQTTGSCRQSMIHGGRFLKSDFVFRSSGDETTGLGIIGWDAGSKGFTSFWTDSRSTRFSVRQSEAGFDGKQIVLYSRALDPDPGQTERRSKTVTRLEDDGKKIVHRQYAIDSEKNERLVMELVLTRKSAAATSSH